MGEQLHISNPEIQSGLQGEIELPQVAMAQEVIAQSEPTKTDLFAEHHMLSIRYGKKGSSDGLTPDEMQRLGWLDRTLFPRSQ